MKKYLSFSNLPISSALKASCFDTPYRWQRFIKDVIAGITVGIIAIPLAMALAIGSGVAPQHGLYTAIIAGIIVAVTGGSRFSVSGPTAAFVVILYPVAQQFGLSGLLVATLMSGILLILMGVMRLGRLIEYIPLPVVVGFTCGIGITIATMQIKDFFGLTLSEMPETYIAKVIVLVKALPTIQWGDTIVGIFTLAVLIAWPRLKITFPGHLPAVIVGVVIMALLQLFGVSVATIGSSFSYTLTDGTVGQGIPSVLPQFILPWKSEGFNLNWQTIQALVPIAFIMAALCAIESLLCAVVLDSMTKTKHSSNGELIGQGLGNLIAPFFGGISATGAIARSVANIKSGATSPISAVIHSIIVLLALIFLASLLSFLPLASMAALLLIVAWNMSDVKKVIDMVKKAPKDDIIVLLACLCLTVLFDMVIAIGICVILAAILVLRRIAKMTKVVELPTAQKNVLLVQVNGPLFFAAADNVFATLKEKINEKTFIVMNWDVVSVLDAGGVSALMRFLNELPQGKELIICGVQFQPLRTLARAEIKQIENRLYFTPTLEDALTYVNDQEVKQLS